MGWVEGAGTCAICAGAALETGLWAQAWIVSLACCSAPVIFCRPEICWAYWGAYMCMANDAPCWHDCKTMLSSTPVDELVAA